MSKPTPMIAANWKCNGTIQSHKDLLATFNGATINHDVQCIIAPPAIHIHMVKDTLTHPKFNVCAQNCVEKSGAFTGEMSCAMVKDYGLKWTIIGHSERRQFYNETNEVVASKVEACLANDMKVIACIGESLGEREEGRTSAVVLAQLEAIAAKVRLEQWSNVVIAYEPVWAIGTGKVATPEQAQEVHEVIRKWMIKGVSASVAKDIRILYGGSVSGANAAELYKKGDINGFLVGGASLKPDFLKVIAGSA